MPGDKREYKADARKEFARLVSAGVELPEAYRRANNKPKLSDKAAKVGAYRMLKSDIVREKQAEIERATDKGAVMTRQRRLEILTAEIEAAHADDRPQAKKNLVACMAELNRMEGDYKPAQVEVKADIVSQFVREQTDKATAEPLVRRSGAAANALEVLETSGALPGADGASHAPLDVL